MQMEHKKCSEIMFRLNAQIEPTLLYIQDVCLFTNFVLDNEIWAVCPNFKVCHQHMVIEHVH